MGWTKAENRLKEGGLFSPCDLMPSNGFSLELPIGKVSKVKDHHGDSIYSVDELGSFEGSFAIASGRKDVKALMKSDADVVYDESKGKLYLNANGSKKGWGKRRSVACSPSSKASLNSPLTTLKGSRLMRTMPSPVAAPRTVTSESRSTLWVRS